MRQILPTSLLVVAVLCGCTSTRTTDTARSGTEQLLISNAVDQSVAKMKVPEVSGRKVFLDEKYLDSVDKGYLVGAVRQKLLRAGALLVPAQEGSEITIELCSGAVGTDNTESFLGVPGLTVPGLPIEMPEVRVYERSSQYGTAKLLVTAYETESGRLLEAGNHLMARAEDSRWNFMGVGPFHSGSVRDEIVENTGQVDLTARVAETLDFGKSDK